MKKLFVLLLSVFVVMNVFAATGTIGEAVDGSSEATLTLTLADQYKFAFIEATADIGTESPLIDFPLQTTGDALTMSREEKLKLDGTQNVFYFYYQAYTNRGDLKIKFSADDLVNGDYDSPQTIKYIASFETISENWDGGTLSPSSITSGSGTSASAFIKDPNGDFDDFNYIGLCKVTISSVENEDLGKKKPGNYSANIYLTLTAN